MNTPAYGDRTPADGLTDMPQEAADPGQIVLDKSNPDIAEAFANCREGDMYKVVKDDENETILEKVESDMSNEDEAPEDAGGQEPGAGEQPDEDKNFPTDKPAIAILLAKKKKQ
jgi:hypothetical protein